MVWRITKKIDLNIIRVYTIEYKLEYQEQIYESNSQGIKI